MADQNTAKCEENESSTAVSTESTVTETASQEKDKELEDLLDDALEDFDKSSQNTSLTPAVNQPESHDTNKSQEGAASDDAPDADQFLEEIFNDDFANNQRQFEDAMKHMLGEDSDLVQHFEKLAEMAGQVDGTEESQKIFSETLQKTLGSLAQNTENIESDLPEDELVKMMSGLGMPGATGDNEEDFVGAMQGMMKSLLSKDILYPSLKEISTKYPDWLAQNKSKLSDEEYQRYEQQHSMMTKVCEEFEKSNPEDGDSVNKESFERVLDLMQQMQGCGQPPADLVGEMVI